MANYLKYGTSQSTGFDEAKEMAKPLTPRSERPRRTYGSLLSSIQTVPGLCGKPRAGKGACWRKAHEGPCP